MAFIHYSRGPETPQGERRRSLRDSGEGRGGEGSGARAAGVLPGCPGQLLYSFCLQWTSTARWMHLDVCNECCGWYASVFWIPTLWTL
ncbi:hypothetical protein GN956_G2651 [Arapaima gigas]